MSVILEPNELAEPADKNILEQMSEDRKNGQENGTVPTWMTTGGYQMFMNKYSYNGQTIKQTYERIAKAASIHTPKPKLWNERFFQLMWDGWLACSSPVLANMGTDRGCPVSCSGGFVGDSIYNFYDSQLETAILTKNGFGTSSYLGDIRARGESISSGGHSSGVVPLFNDFVQVSRDVSQGNTRRGAWAGYIGIDHADFFELVDDLMAEPDDKNVGWIVTDDFIKRLEEKDPDAINRYQRSLKAKCVTGKGYYVFIDKMNRANPEMYKQNGLTVKASNLCTEIALFSDNQHTFTCVLSSMNVALWDDWKDTDAVFWATVFLDCVAQEFINQAKNIRGLEKAVRMTEKGRALGLGTLGFHTYLQKNMIPFDSFDTFGLNNTIFRHLDKESLRASKWMAEAWGEPEWCKGFGVHNTHRIAVAPNCQDPNNQVQTLAGNKSIYDILTEQGFDLKDIENNEPRWIDLNEPVSVPTYDGDAICKRIWFNGIHPTREIEFEDGEKYTYTLNHRLLVLDANNKDGVWKTVGELKTTDTVLKI